MWLVVVNEILTNDPRYDNIYTADVTKTIFNNCFLPFFVLCIYRSHKHNDKNEWELQTKQRNMLIHNSGGNKI